MLRLACSSPFSGEPYGSSSRCSALQVVALHYLSQLLQDRQDDDDEVIRKVPEIFEGSDIRCQFNVLAG